MDANNRLIEIVTELLEEIRDIKKELKDFRTDSINQFENLENAVGKNTDE